MSGISVPSSCVVQTPPAVASAMVTALGQFEGARWLEPCVGQGSLLRAVSSLGVSRSDIVGLDIDSMQGPSDHLGQISRGVEFLSWARSTSQRFDRIVANPPYIAIERLHPEIKSAALSTALDHDVQITANGNAWYAFLCAAITLLKPNGSLCFLLPAAWDFANYAAPLRRSISAYFSAVEIYRTKDPIFRAEDVQDGSIVLIARGRRQRQANGTTSRAEVASTDELINVLASPDRGETLHLQSDATTASGEDSHQRCRLGDLIAIRLGVVTGDTSYFLLTESRRRELGLPRSSVTPVLSRARHLVTSRMTKAQWEKLRNSDERVWLFTPTAQAMKTPAVKAYLSYGRKGGCNMTNHKISTRRSWHKLSAPTNCDAFLSGMSTSLPWLSFREMAALTATNTLYTVKFVDRDLDEKRKIAIGMSMITSSARNQLRHRGRSYAAGLLKHEPCDLLEIEVPTLDYNTVSWGVYREAIAALLKGDEKTAQSIADRYIK